MLRSPWEKSQGLLLWFLEDYVPVLVEDDQLATISTPPPPYIRKWWVVLEVMGRGDQGFFGVSVLSTPFVQFSMPT